MNELKAQTEEKKTARYAISFEPNHLLNGGLRLNIEKKIHPTDWIELNLTGYYLARNGGKSNNYWLWASNGYYISNSHFESISGLSGLGIGSTYKHYFPSSIIINTALSYNRYNVEYPGFDFIPYKEDGLTFFEYRRANVHQPFHKLAAHVALGARSTFERLFFVEGYAGLGVAYSFYDENKRNYNETMFGYGYRGIYLTIGIKLGFNIR
jgi:hypothetical protein